MGLRDIGAGISANTDLVYEDYIDVVKSGDLSTGAIDTTIAAGLTSYADKTYVDTKDGLNATKAYVDTGDALRVRTSTKDVVNGVPGLDATGKVLPARINLPTTQGYFHGPWSPSSYNGAKVDATTETTIYTVPVTDPGFPYKLIILGTVDGFSSLVAEHPQVLIRTGSTSGEIIARGGGLQDSYYLNNTYSDDFNGSALDISKWGILPTVPTRPNLAWDPDTSNGFINTQVNVRRTGVWIGTQPGTDNYRVQITGRAMNFGQLRFYMHGNAAWTQWVGVNLLRQSFGAAMDLIVGTSPDLLGGASGGSFNLGATGGFNDGDVVTLEYNSTTNTYTAVHNGAHGVAWTDTTNVILHGPTNRGIAVFTNPDAGSGGFQGQGIDNFIITEPNTNPGNSPIHLAPVSAQTTKTGSTTVYVRMQRSSTAATVSATTYKPNIHIMAVPA